MNNTERTANRTPKNKKKSKKTTAELPQKNLRQPCNIPATTPRKALPRKKYAALWSLLFQLRPRLGLGNEPDTREDAQRSRSLGKTERIQPDDDSKHDRDDGLHVIVHGDDRRPQKPLSDRHHEIRNERGADDDIPDAGPSGRRQGSIIDAHQRPEIDGDGDYGSKEKHPLHGGNGRILDDGIAKSSKVDGVTYGTDDAQHVAGDAGRMPCPVLTDIHQQQGPETPQSDAARFQPGNRLTEKNGGEDHGQHGNDRGDDRRIDGRSERQPPQKKHLVELDAEHRREKQHDDIARRDPLAGQETRDRPKQQGGAHHAIDAQGERVDASGIGAGDQDAFTNRGIQSPDDVGDPQSRMPFEPTAIHT